MRVYYGWSIVAALFVVQIITIGMTALGFGVLVKPLSEEFGLTRSAVNLGLVLLLLGTSLSAPVIGRLADRFSVRVLMVGGGLMFAVGAFLFSTAKSPLVIGLAVLLLIGPVVNLCGPLIANTLLARWFFRMRGRVFGLAATAMSLGGFLMVPLFGWCIDQFGWRFAVALLGEGGGILMAIVAFLVIRNRPEEMGLFPDGGDSAPPAAINRAVDGAAKRILGTRMFWLAAVPSSLGQAVGMVVTASLVPLATDHGVSVAIAAFLISAMAISGIVGKLLTGFLAERIDTRYIFSAAMVVGALYLAALLVAPADFALWLGLSLLLGGALGTITPLGAILLAERFTHIGYGTSVGLQALVQIPFVLTSLYATGWLFDLSGSYTLAFLLFMGVALAGAALVLALPKARVPEEA